MNYSYFTKNLKQTLNTQQPVCYGTSKNGGVLRPAVFCAPSGKRRNFRRGKMPRAVGQHAVAIAQNVVCTAVQRRGNPGGRNQPKFNFPPVFIPYPEGSTCAILLHLAFYGAAETRRPRSIAEHAGLISRQNHQIDVASGVVCPARIRAHQDYAFNLRRLRQSRMAEKNVSIPQKPPFSNRPSCA